MRRGEHVERIYGVLKQFENIALFTKLYFLYRVINTLAGIHKNVVYLFLGHLVSLGIFLIE